MRQLSSKLAKSLLIKWLTVMQNETEVTIPNDIGSRMHAQEGTIRKTIDGYMFYVTKPNAQFFIAKDRSIIVDVFGIFSKEKSDDGYKNRGKKQDYNLKGEKI